MNEIVLTTVKAVYRQLARLFPQRYQQEYGDELLAVFSMSLDDAAALGRLHLLFFIGRELRDLPWAVLRKHWQERNHRMSSFYDLGPVRSQVKGWGWLAYLLPFVTVCVASLSDVLIPSGTGTGAVIFTFIFWTLALGIVAVLVFGLWRRLPGWALPCLGALLGVLNLIILLDRLPTLDLLIQKVTSALSSSRSLETPGTYLIYNQVFGFMLGLLLLVLTMLVVVGSTLWPRLHPFTQAARRDWSIISLLMYMAMIAFPLLFYNEWRYTQGYQLLSYAAFGLGGWLYLQGRKPWQRLVGLLVGLFLMEFVNSLGIYLVYPLQDPRFIGSTPRWYESLFPVAPIPALAVMLAMPALLFKILPAPSVYAASGE